MREGLAAQRIALPDESGSRLVGGHVIDVGHRGIDGVDRGARRGPIVVGDERGDAPQ